MSTIPFIALISTRADTNKLSIDIFAPFSAAIVSLMPPVVHMYMSLSIFTGLIGKVYSGGLLFKSALERESALINHLGGHSWIPYKAPYIGVKPFTCNQHYSLEGMIIKQGWVTIRGNQLQPISTVIAPD